MLRLLNFIWSVVCVVPRPFRFAKVLEFGSSAEEPPDGNEPDEQNQVDVRSQILSCPTVSKVATMADAKVLCDSAAKLCGQRLWCQRKGRPLVGRPKQNRAVNALLIQ